MLPVLFDGVPEGFWMNEVERIFGFPAGYTEVYNFGKCTRLRLLGNAWCTYTDFQILRPLIHIFGSL